MDLFVWYITFGIFIFSALIMSSLFIIVRILRYLEDLSERSFGRDSSIEATLDVFGFVILLILDASIVAPLVIRYIDCAKLLYLLT